MHEVLRALTSRVQDGTQAGARDDGLRVALAIEGGGMRGTISAGMAFALHELGLVPAFDAVPPRPADLAGRPRPGPIAPADQPHDAAPRKRGAARHVPRPRQRLTAREHHRSFGINKRQNRSGGAHLARPGC